MTDLITRLTHGEDRRCPFDAGDHNLKPEDPCPICGDNGVDLEAPSRCVMTNLKVLHTEAAEEIVRLREEVAARTRSFR